MDGKPRLLICGATGFIGRNVAEHFARLGQFEVVGTYNRRPAYDLAGMRWVQADLTQAADVEAALSQVDIVIQAAATTSGSKDIVERPYIHTTDNAVMNSLLLRAAFHAGVKHFVFFSCSVMYESSDRPLTEEDFDPSAPLAQKYFASGHTKLFVEKMCEFYTQISPMKATVLRHSNIYGPHDKFDLERSHVFGATITKALTSKDGKLVVWGKGEEARDFLHVDDLISAVEASIDRQPESFGLYNIGCGEAVSVNDLAARICAAIDDQISIEHDADKPSIPTCLCLDCSKARADLGWSPKVGLDEGISRTIGWWRENQPALSAGN